MWSRLTHYLWACAQRLVGPGSILAAFGGVMSYWENAVIWAYGIWPISALAQLATVPGWAAGTITALAVFSSIQTVRCRSLASKLSPKLSIGTPVAVHIPKEAQNPNAVTFKVRVFNKSGENIEACRVRLIEMTNRDGVHSAEEGRAFKRSLDSPADILNQPHDLSFNIPPGGWEDVDIVQIDYRPPTPAIRMLYALQGIRDTNAIVWVPYNLCPHTMRIAASASNCSMPEERTLKLSGSDDDRHLQLTKS